MTHDDPNEPDAPVDRPPVAWGRVALALVGLYLLAAIPMILTFGARGRPGEDQIIFHEPVVHTFARQLPRPVLSDYLSATTPGYHLVLAVVERAISGDPRVLQLSAAAFTVLLLVLLARTVSKLAGTESGWRETRLLEIFALCLPFACSMYVVQAGVWLLPDNAGWLCVLACLGLALREPFGRRTIWLASLALIGLVLVRQVHLWVLGPLWAAAWLAQGIDEPAGVKALLTRISARVKSLVPMVLASAPAIVILALFVREWGGLTPPTFQGQYSGVNFASFAFLLSLLGIGSVFFVGYLIDPLINLLQRRRGHVLLAAVAGAVAAIIPPTTFDTTQGRYSGLWNLVRKVPAIANHTSPLLVVLSAGGAVALLTWCRALLPRDRWIVLGAWFSFGLAQAFSYQLWQRYNEPMVLMMLALMAACSRRSSATSALASRYLTPVRIGGVAAFGVLLAAVAVLFISRFGPAANYDPKLINPVSTPAPAP